MRSERQEFCPEHFIEAKISEIKEAVGNERALVAVSGGVDSSTCAILAQKALGEQIDLVFLDDGLMREGEAEQVQLIFRNMGLNLEVIEVQDLFFKALEGIAGPEQKREAFRQIFYQVLAGIMEKREIKYLIQGTIKADIDETKGGIKTQHNVLEQIGIDFGFKLVEPLRDIYKEEVRQVAQTLGTSEEIFDRMPFPGPGLALRVMGEVTPDKVELVRKATTIVEEELAPYKPFQVFPVLLADETTGVINGERKDGRTIALRSVESKNAMSASATFYPWVNLQEVQGRLTTEIPEVNRVLYDLTPKPPATIEYI